MNTIEDASIAEIEWRSRQPENINFLRPQAFRLLISRLPTVTYFCQTANIPNVSLGVASFKTPFVDVPVPGEKLTFDELSVKFMIQEDMLNYIELYNWITGLGFPEDRDQFAALKRTQNFRFPVVGNSTFTGEYSDCTLLILDSNNNPVSRLTFKDAFPVALSALDFDTTVQKTNYLTASVKFRFSRFTIDNSAL